MADHRTGGAWDLIVTPWHLDEHLPAFPIPATATQVIPPPLPQGTVAARMNRLHQTAADAVAQVARRFPSGPGPSLTKIEECLAAVCTSADVRAA